MEYLYRIDNEENTNTYYRTFTLFSWIENNIRTVVIWDPKNNLSEDIISIYKNSIKKKFSDNINILDNSELNINNYNNMVDIYQLLEEKNINIIEKINEIIMDLSIESVQGFSDGGGKNRANKLKTQMKNITNGSKVPFEVGKTLLESLSSLGINAKPKDINLARRMALKLMFLGTNNSTSFKISSTDLGFTGKSQVEYTVIKSGTDFSISSEDGTDKPNIYVPMENNSTTNINFDISGQTYVISFRMSTDNDKDEERVYITHPESIKGKIKISDLCLDRGYLLIDDIIKIGKRSITIGSLHFEYNESTLCFLGSEKVLTDQGNIKFNKLTIKNTINGHKIKKIIKTKNSEKCLIVFLKHSLDKHIPNKTTFMGLKHGIYLDDEFIKKNKLVYEDNNLIPKIKGKKMVRGYNLINITNISKIAILREELLYNILMDDTSCGSMYVNGMLCETLNPNDSNVIKHILSAPSSPR